MIFVTVGSTLPFDPLLQTIDDLIARGELQGDVICQTGTSKYIPGHCESFKFRPSIRDLMQSADLVIAHGGTGTVFELLSLGGNFIACANPLAADDHQRLFLARMEKACGLLWVDDLSRLSDALEGADAHTYRPLAEPRLHADLTAFISG